MVSPASSDVIDAHLRADMSVAQSPQGKIWHDVTIYYYTICVGH